MEASYNFVSAIFDKSGHCTNFVLHIESLGLSIQEVSLPKAREPVYLVWKGELGAVLYPSNHGTALRFWLGGLRGVSAICGCCSPVADTTLIAAIAAEHGIKKISVRKPHFFMQSPIHGLVEEDFKVSYKLHQMVGVKLP